MQREVAAIAREPGIALLGPNCMGLIDLNAPAATYIDDLPPNLRRGGTAAIAQSGSVTDAFVHAGTRIGWSRIISCGSEAVLDLCDHLAACLDDPATDSIVLFVEGFKRPERFLALADRALAEGKPILAVKVGRSSQAQGRRDRAQRQPRGRRSRHRRGPPRRRRDPLRRSRRPDRGCRARRAGRAAPRPRGGEGPHGRRDRLDRRGLADRRPRAVDRAWTCRRSPPPPARRSRAPSRPSPTSRTRSTHGAPTRARPPTAPASRRIVASGAYDVVALVHDFPYRSQPGEVALAVELGAELVAATASAPEVLPVFVSLTSGDVTEEVEAQMDAAGGVPILRGTRNAFGAIARLAWWERAACGARGQRPRSRALARDSRCARPRYAHADAPTARPRQRRGPSRSGSRSSSCAPRACPWSRRKPSESTTRTRCSPRQRRRPNDSAGRSSVKVDAPGFAHKTDAGGVPSGSATPPA